MIRILLADDDVELCEMLREYLAAEGFDLVPAHDGDTALEKLRASRFDLVILDVMMPRKNGLDVLRELRASSNTPVLMLTARGEDADSIVGLELGADDYLAKPLSLMFDTQSANKAVIRVRDRGPGVPENMLARLFEPFVRVGDARDRGTGGYGLGLAIAERAVRLHGGEISACNLAEGGFAVTISLPA